MREALAEVVAAVRAKVLVLSCNDEAWISPEDLARLCAPRGAVAVLAFDSRRYVGAQIGIHSPAGRKVGRVRRLRNVEHLVVCGRREEIEPALCSTSPAAA
jgi:adenine-specific DNA-methyltransferase